MTTPLIRVIRRRFPTAQIDYLTKKKFVSLLESNPYLDRVIGFDDSQGFAEWRRFKKEIHETGYDWLIDIHQNLRTAYLKFGLRVGDVFGFDKRIFPRFLLVHFKINRYPDQVPVYQRYIESLKDVGLKYDDAGLDFFMPPAAEQEIEKRFAPWLAEVAGPIIGMVPGAGYETKRWTETGFAQTADRLIEKYQATIIFLGGNKEKSLMAEIKSLMRHDVLDVSGQLSLVESAALMQHCHLVLANDTGLMHMAAALKKPLIAFFGSTSAELGFLPCSPRQIILEKQLPCRPCTHVGKHHCPKGHFRCMRTISSAAAVAAADDVLTNYLEKKTMSRN